MLSRKYTIGELVAILSARIGGNSALMELSIDRIATDSRYRGIGHHTCFFALESERNNGHDYISDAYNKGVRCFVIHNEINSHDYNDACFIHVSDSLQALHMLATFHRNELSYPIIGITGSNGKTVVKEWLYQILSIENKVSRSPKSYNSQIGVPLSLLILPNDAEIGLIEAGISREGEMSRLQKLIKPDIGIITNIHNAHMENFTSQRQLVSEKVRLFEECKQIVYRKDYSLIDEELRSNDKYQNAELVSWSNNAAIKPEVLVSWESKLSETSITLKFKDEVVETNFNHSDNASLENVVQCIITSKLLGVSNKSIVTATSKMPSVAMRLQQLKGINNCTLVNDTYNSDITSLEVALNFTTIQRQHEKRSLILSDIFQSGIPKEELYKRVNKLCIENGIDRIFGIGPDLCQFNSVFEVPFFKYQTTESFLDEIRTFSFIDEAILIKGARSFGFERISNVLEYKRHETHLEINLSAVIDNLNYYKSLLKPDVSLMVMVKAFSYGTGSFEIANVLEHHGVDYLTVAYIDEGVVLRNNGISCPIMVMNPAFGEMERLIEYDLEPEVYNFDDLYLIAGYCKRVKKSIKIHLKVETGMHRLGFESDQLDEISKVISEHLFIQLKSVFSHLVGSDTESLDEFTKEQIKAFSAFCNALESRGHSNFKRHILNSDGILRFRNDQNDMVRLGIGLYGISSVPEFRDKLKSVISLKSRISQIKHLKKGESVGYGRAFVADKDIIVATIPIGYADGLVRKLGNGAWFFRIKGEKAPIVGNICMDMTMIDISNTTDVREKDEVTVIAGNADIYKMAEKRETISYEILTSFSERVKRTFYYGE